MKNSPPLAAASPPRRPPALRRARAARLAMILLLGSALAFPALAVDVGKWKRHAVSLPNASHTGNPYELEVEATFTHSGTGTRITMPGYYAGGDVWKVNFMPTELGEWTYRTASADPDLDGVTGSINCVASGLKGMLEKAGNGGKKFRQRDGDYLIPFGFQTDLFTDDGSYDFDDLGSWLESMNVQILHAFGQAAHRCGECMFDDWQNLIPDADRWDEMERRMDALTAHNVGVHWWFYVDNPPPPWGGQTSTERWLVRYAVARLAAYPILLWNTGIDITEFRSDADIDWFGEQIAALDPYGHFRSSRHGGGSGSAVMANQTFDSDGERTADIDVFLSRYQARSVPVSFDDFFGENRPSHPTKNHTPADIRRATWKAVVAGGVALAVRDADSIMDFPRSTFQSDWESEQWVQFVNPFLADELGALFGSMEPRDDLVGGVECYAISNSTEDKILYLLLGENDTYDSGGGGEITVKLASLSDDYGAEWLDPRTGERSSIGTLTGGQNHILTPPSRDDWVMILVKGGGGGEPGPAPPNVNGLHRTDQ